MKLKPLNEIFTANKKAVKGKAVSQNSTTKNAPKVCMLLRPKNAKV
jgi:hypothetical protein